MLRLELEKRLPVEIEPEAIEVISRQALPGNVRELQNLIERLAILHPDGRVGVAQLPNHFRIGTEDTPGAAALQVVEQPRETSADPRLVLHDEPEALPDAGLNLKEHLAAIERDLVMAALDNNGWVVAKAAKQLGLQRTTLVEKMRKLGITKSA